MKHSRLRLTILTLILAGAASAPVFAACPALPDGPDSHNVDNGRARALCLQQELSANTSIRDTQTQIDTLQTTIQQMQIQRRLDSVPLVQPYRP